MLNVNDSIANYCPDCVHGYDTLWADKHEHQGGYSTHVRSQEQFVYPIPDALKSTDAASMQVLSKHASGMDYLTKFRLCAGLTVYSPLVRSGAGPGKKVGVVGLGGL